MDVLTLIFVFIVGFLGSFLGNMIGGGGGLITVPGMIMLGIPPQVVVATKKLGTFGSSLPSIYLFSKAKKIVTELTIPLAIGSLIGSAIGAKILIEINEELFSKLLAIMLLIALPFTFLKKDFGLVRKVKSKLSRFIGFVTYYFVAIFNGFMGAGGGLIQTYSLINFNGLTYIEANGTKKIPYLFGRILSTIIFAAVGLIDYVLALILFVSCFFGAYLGSKVAINKGDRFIKIIFSFVVFVLAIKLLFFP
ncbi:sulfite exporter TauE/SafE family protein [Candidatus Woesearchaeota archaeon]|jgi:uncharacterized protein|nr:sulfite exporter TauE/SafE family protein [Candidatus Woesearchaeota archaeon]